MTSTGCRRETGNSDPGCFVTTTRWCPGRDQGMLTTQSPGERHWPGNAVIMLAVVSMKIEDPLPSSL